MNENVERILLDQSELKARIRELGKEISEDFKERPILVVCILKGSVVFFADLIREIDADLQMAFISAASYGAGSTSSGKVEVTSINEIPIADRAVLVVEDIVDSGRTIARIRESFAQAGAANIKVCTLLDKPDRREVEVEVDYCGFEIPNEFVVGYGLDYDQKYRNLPYVGILKREVYERSEAL